MRTLLFVLSAWWFKHAYIDMDGCLLYRMRCPPGEPNPLIWWQVNLKPTPIVRSRLILLYLLRALGVRLFVWTNRYPEHEHITRTALGRHVWLFRGMYHLRGLKDLGTCHGPVMDDQVKYLDCGKGWSLLVEQR